MIKLSDIEIKLAEQLLLTIVNKEMNVTYEELAKRVDENHHMNPRNVGKPIGNVSALCHELGLPLLSAKVINKTSQRAGEGFYPLFEQFNMSTDGLSEAQLFKRELKRIRECQEWYKLSDYLGLDISFHNNIETKTEQEEPQIRIIPMGWDIEFGDKSIEEIQNDFFLDTIKYEKNGRYNYREKGINAPEGSLILFQKDNLIIASAILLGVDRQPVDEIYKGQYIFDTNSIKVFQPILIDDIKKICNMDKFSNVKQRINPDKKKEIIDLINKKSLPLIPEEIPMNEYSTYPEGSKNQIMVNKYERNPKARAECIKIHGSKCCICGFDFGNMYGKVFEGKIQVHHIKPISECGGNYKVNAETDLVPVCPNCHFVLHSKTGGTYSIDEVKKFIKK